MKLFDTIKAPNPRRVRWLMAEKSIEDIEIIQVDLFKGEHKTAEYLAKTGLPNVPALELDDGTVITETLAICRYLESLYPTPNLFGTDSREIAIIEMWTRRMEMMLATPIMLTVRNSFAPLAALGPQNPVIAETNMETVIRMFKYLDRTLAGQDFITCGRLTIADIVTFASIDFAKLIKLAPDEALTNVHHWADMMRARPAAAAGMS